MKKITACLLVLSMILNIASCGISGSQTAAPTAAPDSAAPSDSGEEKDEDGTTSPDTNTNENQSDGQSSASLYAGVVRDYESKYGKLTFNNVNGFNSYTGVFLIKLIDFDKDGVDELLIGYSTKLEGYPEYITAPKLDVWSIVNSNPVRSYEGAIVHHGDIGSHCAYIDMDGQYFLINGYSGYDCTKRSTEALSSIKASLLAPVRKRKTLSAKISNRDTRRSECKYYYYLIIRSIDTYVPAM